MAVIADTLKAKKRLVEVGFSDEKAEGIVAIFNEADVQIATKLDLELFRKDVKAEIADSRKETAAEFKDVRVEIELVRKDIELVRRDVRIAVLLATITILAAIKFLG